MLVGRLPFPPDEAPMVMLMRIVHEPVPPPRSINPDLDPDLAAWIERLLAKDPQDRIRSGADAWAELEGTVIRIFGARRGPAGWAVLEGTVARSFGARWRGEARLQAGPAGADELSPLTPAPFTGAA